MNKTKACSLIIVLSIALFQTTALANDINTVRQYLGLSPLDVETIKINPPEVEEESLITEETIEVEDYSGAAEESHELNRGIGDLSREFERGFKDGVSAKVLLPFLDKLSELNRQLDVLVLEEKNRPRLRRNLGGTVIIEQAVIEVDVVEEKEEVTIYELGSVGENTISPTENVFNLLRPFGYKLDSNKEVVFFNNQINLKAVLGTNILSIWNGEVIQIDEKEDGSNKVHIHHGENLVTTYSNIVELSVGIGDKVHQGKVIGKAGGSELLVPELDNNIGFQVIVGGEYQNPILIYGIKSKEYIGEWYKNSLEVFTLRVGKKFYYVGSGDNLKVGDNKANTIRGAAEVVGEYVRVNPWE